MPRQEKIIAGLCGLLVFVFAFPKLFDAQVSQNLFAQINTYLGFSGHWFRYLTGVLELGVGLSLLAGIVLKEKSGLLYRVYQLGALGLAGTMSGAVFTELAIRPGEDPALTALALVLFAVGALLVWKNRPLPARSAKAPAA